eukprot:gb/GECG01013953.1/.p1 GENE.gb/GECG01013953.1/~~gb/GECG01013953.1/.p1  ORF type:complete len:215 (+),score=54.98 gb/GECG01013953.1/:1-645(+)
MSMARRGGGRGAKPQISGEQVGQMVGDMLLQKLEHEEEKLDEKLKKMDNLEEDDLEKIRQRRLREMKKKHEQKQKWLQAGHGKYQEVPNEKEFFQELKNCERAVAHFYRNTTRRCEILDGHLEKLARQHIETKFIKVNAEKSPYLAEKLNIWCLPTMVLVKNGKTDHSIVGFDDMGGHDEFSTKTLENVLLYHEIVKEEYCMGEDEEAGEDDDE